MSRLSAFVENNDAAFSQPAHYEVIERGDCMVAGVPQSDPALIEALVSELPGPFALLYVLHTSHGEALPGRYQRPELSQEEVRGFLQQFRKFLMTDGRYDLWVRCFGSESTLVWDRHDLLYTYGDVMNFESTLSKLGHTVGQLGIPYPHSHHYLRENDEQACLIVSRFSWVMTELRDEDKQ